MTARASIPPPSDPLPATYIYCVVESRRAPSIRGVPESVPGAGPVRLVAIEPAMWAVVADAPLGHFAGEQLQRELQDIEAVSRHAIAHASVIEFFFRKSPVIPLKLFTLFSSDARAREHLAGQRKRLSRLLGQLRGLEEWGVRVIAGDVEAESARTLTSGRDYLQVKKRLHAESTAPSREAVRAAEGALKALGRMASKSRRDAYPPAGKGRPYVTGASFLVRAGRRRQWQARAAAIAATLARSGHRLEMTGPWPPYHFVTR